MYSFVNVIFAIITQKNLIKIIQKFPTFIIIVLNNTTFNRRSRDILPLLGVVIRQKNIQIRSTNRIFVIHLHLHWGQSPWIHKPYRQKQILKD